MMTLRLQTFNKDARDLPMTQASIAWQKIEHVGGWYLWQQQDMDLKARTLHGWLNGMHGVGSTVQDHLINVPYRETAAAPTGSDEYQAICRNNGLGNT
ncbi:predicted protein [Lichtheimia corymbifera JMRC:FSU:9682]|uniref:Uncharacterized protein n=1 Tax=Lichtheimia corymbifera JMRC:FSU:9682 TaxID=1263082 RepID=A0A068RR36_9FUNG|nr:predicted protein [Lichtheimia corymbifera JMRC:FSU:9682]